MEEEGEVDKEEEEGGKSKVGWQVSSDRIMGHNQCQVLREMMSLSLPLSSLSLSLSSLSFPLPSLSLPLPSLPLPSLSLSTSALVSKFLGLTRSPGQVKVSL